MNTWKSFDIHEYHECFDINEVSNSDFREN